MPPNVYTSDRVRRHNPARVITDMGAYQIKVVEHELIFEPAASGTAPTATLPWSYECRKGDVYVVRAQGANVAAKNVTLACKNNELVDLADKVITVDGGFVAVTPIDGGWALVDNKLS